MSQVIPGFCFLSRRYLTSLRECRGRCDGSSFVLLIQNLAWVQSVSQSADVEDLTSPHINIPVRFHLYMNLTIALFGPGKVTNVAFQLIILPARPCILAQLSRCPDRPPLLRPTNPTFHHAHIGPRLSLRQLLRPLR